MRKEGGARAGGALVDDAVGWEVDCSAVDDD